MLEAILLAFKHNLSLKTLDSDSREGGEPIASSALLQVALSLPSIASQAALSCIQLLHQGALSGGRGGGGGGDVHCLSALRLYLQERANGVIDLVNKGRSIVPPDATVAATAVTSLSKEFADIARACMACIRENSSPSSRYSSGLFSSSNSSEDVTVGSGVGTVSPAALELLPVIIELLMLISAEDAAAEVIDSLFLKNWPSHLMLTLCNLVCDLIPFFSSRRDHWATFKVLSCLQVVVVDINSHAFKMFPVLIMYVYHFFAFFVLWSLRRRNCVTASQPSPRTTSLASSVCVCTFSR